MKKLSNKKVIGFSLAGFALLVEGVNIFMHFTGSSANQNWFELYAPGMVGIILLLTSIFLNDLVFGYVQASVAVCISATTAIFGGTDQQFLSAIMFVVTYGMVYNYELFKITKPIILISIVVVLILFVIGALLEGRPARAINVSAFLIAVCFCLYRLYGSVINRLVHENSMMKGLSSIGESSAQITHLLKSKTSALQTIVDEEMTDETLELLKTVTFDLQHMVGQIMNFSKNSVQMISEVVDINRIMESVIFMTQHHPRIQGRVIINQQFTSFKRLRIVPFELKNVLQNLIINAAEAIDKTGFITVAYDGTAISVEDTGHGIKTCNKCKRISCESCSNFQLGITTKEHGSGFGMVHVQEFCRNNGFKLKIDSVIGQGTLIRILVN